MGAINYKRNNIVTLGYNIPKKEEEAEKEAENEKEINDVYFDIEEVDFEDLKEIYNKYSFDILDVKIENGYYDGFYIDIDFDYFYFENTEEKQETLKEATRLKKFLLESLNVGMVACCPSWCTSYSTVEESKKEIEEAIKDLKEGIKNTLTEKNYFKKYDIFGNLKEAKK